VPALAATRSLHRRVAAQQVTFTKDGKASVSPQNSNGPLGARTLAYGQSAHSGRVVCISRTDGLRCEDTATGHGFLVARRGIKTF
jgi:hypothetical protein